MKFVFAALFFCLPVLSLAYIVEEVDQSQPYELVPIQAPLGESRSYLGELTGYPIMYEVVAENDFTFTAQVRQPSTQSQHDFALILVRKDDRGGGVTEVARMHTNAAEWARGRDGEIGLTFANSPVLSEEVGPGTYRLEISTPENAGAFMLTVGDRPADTGYWQTLGSVRTTQQFFGRGVFSLLGSNLVFYPIGIVILLFMFYKTWQYWSMVKVPKKHGSA